MTAFFDFAVGYAQVCFALAMSFAAIRMLRGPRAQDRVLGLDALWVNAMLMLLMLGIRTTTTVYFDMALLISLFGFVGSVALAKFLMRSEVIEP